MDMKLPEIKRTIEDLIKDEEGSVPRKKLITIGSTIMLMGIILGLDEAFGAHSSHSSHSSHTSHSSTSYHRSHTSHTSHSSHSNHSNHASHSSHSNHSNHASHNSHVSAIGSEGISSDYSSVVTEEMLEIQVPQENTFLKTVDRPAEIAITAEYGQTKDPMFNEIDIKE